MARMVADCRRIPSESNCSLTIIGEADEVVRAASVHAADVHGHERHPRARADDPRPPRGGVGLAVDERARRDGLRGA